MEADRWTQNILHQIQLAPPPSPASISMRFAASVNATARTSTFDTYQSTAPDAGLTEVEEWVKSSKWRVFNITHGIRIFQLSYPDSVSTQQSQTNNYFTRALRSLLTMSPPPPLPCLRVNIPVGGSASNVFVTIMNYPAGCRTGIIKNVRIIEYIDNSTDFIHIELEPVYAYPTWTGEKLLN